MSALRTRMQPWLGRPGIRFGSLVPWMPTTPPPGPIAELGVRGGAERVVAVDRRILHAQFLAHPEVPLGGGRRGLADAHAGPQERLALLGQRQRGAPQIDADLRIHAYERTERAPAHPPLAAVRTARDADSHPLVVCVSKYEIDLGALVLCQQTRRSDTFRVAVGSCVDRDDVDRMRPLARARARRSGEGEREQCREDDGAQHLTGELRRHGSR